MEYVDKKPLIICICGKARSGKSTVSSYLEKYFVKLNKKVIISQYTKYLKKYISDITGNNVTDDEKPRDLLQNLSSELIKGILSDKDFFIRRQIEDVKFYSYFFDVILINDVRFPKEISVLKNKFPNVYSIGVKRDNYEDDLTVKQKNDITETSLDSYNEYDFIINNNDINDLEKHVLNIFKDIRKKVYDE